MNLMPLRLGAFALALFATVFVWVIGLGCVIALCTRQWKIAAWSAVTLSVLLLGHWLGFILLISAAAVVLRRWDVLSFLPFVLLGLLLAPFAQTAQGTALLVTFFLMCVIGAFKWLTGEQTTASA